jgi:hypothetical protein
MMNDKKLFEKQKSKAERPNTTREDQDLDGSDINGDERQKSQNERDKQRQST